MRNIISFFERLGKEVLDGALCLIAAVILFFSPVDLLYTIVRIIGALIIITAAIRFIYLLKKRGSSLPVSEPLHALALFALGAILVGIPGGTLRFIFSAIGVYLIATAISQAARLMLAPPYARNTLWWVDAIFSAAVFALGVWLLLSPVGAGRVTEIVAAVSLTLKGVDVLLGLFGNAKPENKKNKNGDIEADFIDRSHEI